ncbi:THAP domain-containing protein 8-like [Lates japonicus]
MDRPSGRFRSTGIQVNLPETSPATTEKPTPQHIVDEEAILQLMKNCPMCNRKCRCSKHTRGPYFIVYQSCYYCDYQRKWASQPEAKNMNIHKPNTLPKKKLQPKDKVFVNKARVSESHNQLET